MNKKKEPRKYTLILIPSGSEGTEQRTFSFSLWKTVFVVTLVFVIGLATMFGFFALTPAGNYIPFLSQQPETGNSNAAELQNRFMELSEQLMQLRENNIQMRSMLGQKISKEDSLFLVHQRSNPDREQQIVENVQENHPPEISSGLYGKFSSTFKSTSLLEFPLMMPTQGFISRRFEPNEGHFGIDIAGKEGSIITAPADGFVLFSDWTYDNGNMIILVHNGGYVTTFKHAQSLLHAAFTEVKRGEAIATLGNTGRLSTGPHLHFGLWKNGSPLNPEEFLLQTSRNQAL